MLYCEYSHLKSENIPRTTEEPARPPATPPTRPPITVPTPGQTKVPNAAPKVPPA